MVALPCQWKRCYAFTSYNNAYALGDQAAEEALYDMESMRNFSGPKLSENAIPDETTILKFRRLIEKHDLSNALFDDINAYLVL